MTTIEGVPVPRGLLEQYNYEFSSGIYLGSCESFCRVRYLMFRTQWRRSSSREPASFHMWMRSISIVDAATEKMQGEYGDK